MSKIRVTVWNEFRHERTPGEGLHRAANVYPGGLHKAIAEELASPDLEIRLACLDEPRNGLPPEILDTTDVLMWWGHCAHGEVADEVVERVRNRVHEGMGLIVLHSGHMSKIFRALMGTACTLKWREANEHERVWTIDPVHPIAAGVPESFVIPHTEMYGERFDIPQDGEIVFMSWYQGGEVFRSGVTFRRGFGKIFYFAPGHETYPIYRQPEVVRILGNAVRWAAPTCRIKAECPCAPAQEPIVEME